MFHFCGKPLGIDSDSITADMRKEGLLKSMRKKDGMYF